MPDSQEAAVASPDGAISPAGPPMVRRDLAGNVADPVATTRTSDGCSHFTARTQAPGAPPCARQPIDVPVSLGPVVFVLIGGLLIIGGVLTFYERGPGRFIRPRPRRRGATQRARRWRQRIGAAMGVFGCICLLRAFG